MPLTERRQRICQFIARFRADKGYAPTIREIASGAEISSTSVVQYHLLALERAGVIRRTHGYSRTIVLNSRHDLGQRSFRSRQRLIRSEGRSDAE